MRKLDRACVNPPTCLSSFHHGQHNWQNVSPLHKEEIRASLEQMQGRRCAYCEGPLDDLGHHIEHFRRRGANPHLTFCWENLYWSCYQDDSCGRFKDHNAESFNVDDLVDPCVDDPDWFFRFRSDGTINVRGSLNVQEAHRANETIRVFNLHPQYGRLRNMRKTAASGYLKAVEDIYMLDDAERSEYIEIEIQATAQEPFSTVIRHLFEEAL